LQNLIGVRNWRSREGVEGDHIPVKVFQEIGFSYYGDMLRRFCKSWSNERQMMVDRAVVRMTLPRQKYVFSPPYNKDMKRLVPGLQE